MSFKNAGIRLQVADTFTELYRTPLLKESVVHALYIANTLPNNGLSADVKVTVKIAVADPDPLILTPYEVIVINDATVKPGNSLVFDKPINLAANQYITISCNTGGQVCHVFASVLEELLA
jgi:hypothetical protein